MPTMSSTTRAFSPAPVPAAAARSCQSCLINGVCLAGGLRPEQVRCFETIKGPGRVVQRGEQLFCAGTEFESLYIVRSGSFRVSVTSEDGLEQVTGFYLPGEIMGLDAIECDHHRTTAMALETSSVCALPFHRLSGQGVDIADLQKQAWRLTSREIMIRQELLLIIARKDAEARLAAFLLSLSARLARIGFSSLEFRLSMSRQDIGDYLGLTVETVSRLFTRFQNRGLVGCNRRLVALTDVAGLEFLSGMATARHRGWITANHRRPSRTAQETASVPTRVRQRVAAVAGGVY